MRKTIRILAISYLSYLALVLLVVTPALNLLPPWLVEKYLGREFHSEIIWFNPFNLSLEVRKTELPEHDGSPFVSLDRATANLSIASIWSGALVFDELRVDQLYVHVVQHSDGDFNFSDMLTPEDPKAPPAEPGGIPALTIGQFNFNAKQIVFTREKGESVSSTSLSGIDITIDGLSTVLEEGKPYTLSASGENGGHLKWEGQVSVPKSYSEGTLSVTNIQLRPLWHFAKDMIAFELVDGKLGVEGQYKVDWSEGLKYRVSEGEIRLDELSVKPGKPDELPDTDVALGSLVLAGVDLDGTAQHVKVKSLTIAELAVRGWREGEHTSLVSLFAVNVPEETGQEPPAPEDGGAKEWTAELDDLRLVDSSVSWRSEYTDPARLEVTPLEASANSISWPLQGDTRVAANLTINGEASAAVEGTLDLDRGVGALGYELTALPLRWFNPNFPSALQAKITDGQVSVKGVLNLAEFAPTTIEMDGAIEDFAGGMIDTEESLTSWETVRWESLQVDVPERQVALRKLSIDNYTGRLHIKQDGSINAQNVWKEEIGEQVEDVKESLAEKPWGVSVPLIRITDSEIDFMDESLPIQFRTVIGDIEGNIANVSSEPGVQTKVDIKGSVDGYAPVALAGTAKPLNTPPALDLELTFAGVDMALLSPYSGTYAGYAIERGVLNLDLKYAMEDQRLQGHNKIVIEQMKLGEKTGSEKAVDLPLEFALALLTDSNGVIDMDIPVNGSVDDPEFNIGSVVLGAVVNLITKIVTSPFNLLASLVDSDEDLQRLNFKSGSAELEASTIAKLDSLASALAQRPELNMVVTGRLQLQADRERMQKNSLKADMLAAGLSEEELSSKGPEWDKAIVARYQAVAPGETELTVREQYLKLAQAMPLADSELLELASARAIAVKTYLVNEASLEPDRAAIAKPSLEAKANLYSGVELEIES